MRNDCYPFARAAHSTGHLLCVGLIEGHKPVNICRPLDKQLPDGFAMRRGKLLDEEIFSRKASDDGRPAAVTDPSSHPQQQGIGEMNHVGTNYFRQPVGETIDLLVLMALLTLQAGDGQRPQIGRTRLASPA